MPDVLLVYATTHGHTAKIANRIGDVLREGGLGVDLHDVRTAAKPDLRAYDGVIVGASVHGGHHQHEIVDWARGHARALNGLPSAFFSVCLTAADDTEESHRATREYIDVFLDDTGWIPRETVSFAGALQYREYDFVTRLVMRVLMRRGEHPTDVTEDYDYTDWDAVDSFGRTCAKMLTS
jgi:menaquinone-dependent protoporphyrinogen oxidase